MSIFRFKTPNRRKKPNPVPNTGPVKIASNVKPIGMSYWRNINYHADRDSFYLFLSIDDELNLFEIDKGSLAVKSQRALGIHHTGEGCYFSASKHDYLYVPIGTTLYVYNVFTGDRIPIWESQYILWQCHSSHDDQIHSATLRDSQSYGMMAWGLSNGDIFELKGHPDECQVDKSGKWLFIKEDNLNRIIYIPTAAERIIPDELGALGHSDCGFECALGENDYSDKPGALDRIDFITGERTNLYSTGIWNMGYVSVQNDKILLTTPSELILVNDGRKICDNFTESNAYEHRAKANLCPLGEFATWTAMVAGELNCYLVRI